MENFGIPNLWCWVTGHSTFGRGGGCGSFRDNTGLKSEAKAPEQHTAASSSAKRGVCARETQHNEICKIAVRTTKDQRSQRARPL